MGIGNTRATSDLSGFGSAIRTHYPSWGLETKSSGVREARSLIVNSLPLMGIGNPVQRVRLHRSRLPELITPHGDWKLFAEPGVGHADRPTRLITPHGDWKPPVFVWFRQRFELITPHGDWKRAPQTCAPRSGRISLPLMGIGNPGDRGLPDSRRGSRPHYPSWGLETPSTAVRAVDPSRHLITPHGDWKPMLLDPSIAVTESPDSLPLMGIGNCSRRNPLPRTTAVDSLPLMGIGNVGPCNPVIVCSPNSLPLMGIGNTASSPRRMRGLRSHYPSWGLETRHDARTCDQVESREISLPLMGIGNSIGRCRNPGCRRTS